MAKAFNAQLIILSVSEGMAAGNSLEKFAQTEHTTIGDLLESEAEAIAVTARKAAERLGARNIRTQAAVGDAATVILDTASARKADSIVVGKRGRGRLKGLMLGSVSQKLSALAPTAVVIVP